MNTFEQLEEYFKKKENSGKTLPNIRHFNSTDIYCTPLGDYKTKTLEESLLLFIKDSTV
jgi:hypothetical protein